MKFLHTGDLHIGKTVNDFSMLEDQKYIFRQMTELAKKEQADALIIAGDIYDRAIPPAEGVVLFNDFLTEMVQARIPVLMVSGNHDSPERVAFAGDILKKQGIHIAGMYEPEPRKVMLEDAYGEVGFVLLPFVRPAAAGAKNSGEAVKKMLASMNENADSNGFGRAEGKRQVLVTHYFVTDNGREPELSDGETTVHVGELDNVEVSCFDGFDYVALGHIHRPQKIGKQEVYYAGAPLAYSFSEAGAVKSVNLVELKEKGNLSVRQIPLQPLHEMRKIKGRLEELMRPEIAEAADCRDYIRAEITDEEELIDPIGTLRTVYPNIMQIVLSKNEQTEQKEYISRMEEKRKSIQELFKSFYEVIREEEPDEERMKIIMETAAEAERENGYEA